MNSSEQRVTRILFVDDEPLVLDGLRRTLRAYREQWSMRFCEGPLAALEALREERFDVVVTDIRMPVMDGTELLNRIRDLYPEIVRIVLSGQSEQERILRAVGPAHQYLSKPCDPEELRATIVKANLLGQRLNVPLLRTLVSRLNVLPSIPTLYMELMDKLRNEDCPVSVIGALISRDISMTAKLLQLVNSSFFGFPVHVVDIKHATALLGTNTIRQLVLAAGIFRQLDKSTGEKLFLNQMFDHSVAVASLAKMFAKQFQQPSEVVDNAFLAGVLHDIGKIVLADNFGKEYVQMYEDAETEHASLYGQEQDRFGASHAEVGGYLLGLWGLPQEIIEAVAFHHDPVSSSDQHFTALTAVHVANAIYRAESEEELNCVNFDRAYLHRLGVAEELEHWQALAAGITMTA